MFWRIINAQDTDHMSTTDGDLQRAYDAMYEFATIFIIDIAVREGVCKKELT